MTHCSIPITRVGIERGYNSGVILPGSQRRLLGSVSLIHHITRGPKQLQDVTLVRIGIAQINRVVHQFHLIKHAIAPPLFVNHLCQLLVLLTASNVRFFSEVPAVERLGTGDGTSRKLGLLDRSVAEETHFRLFIMFSAVMFVFSQSTTLIGCPLTFTVAPQLYTMS